MPTTTPIPARNWSGCGNGTTLLFGRPETSGPLAEAELGWLRALLITGGDAISLPGGPWDADTETAAWALSGAENLEERWVPGGQFDPVALAYLREKYAAPLAGI